jgi:hypothetical protein
MEKAGIELHSFAQITELFDACENRNLLEPEARKHLESFVAGY